MKNKIGLVVCWALVFVFPCILGGMLALGLWCGLGAAGLFMWMKEHFMQMHLVVFAGITTLGACALFSLLWDGVVLYRRFLSEFKTIRMELKG